MAPRPLPLALALTVVLTIGWTSDAAAGPTARAHDYDQFFRKYTKRYFGIGFDWRLFKAQAITESNLRPGAISPRGARGVMQVLPTTYREIQLKNPDIGDIGDPEWNIAAGIWYARQLWNAWREDADRGHQQSFMLGSYNAGRQTLLRAQRLARERLLNYREWPSIETVAPSVPRWAYRETLGYVVKVMANLRSLDRQGRVRPD